MEEIKQVFPPNTLRINFPDNIKPSDMGSIQEFLDTDHLNEWVESVSDLLPGAVISEDGKTLSFAAPIEGDADRRHEVSIEKL